MSCLARPKHLLLAIILSLAAAAAAAQDFKPAKADIAAVPGLPAIGKWMITPELKPAHWLGEIHRGKQLREPINVVIVDAVSSTTAQAKARLLEGAAKAGFPSRQGHSSGYWAWVGDRLEPQFPDTPAHAFSDEPFTFNNNHGRFFGPHPSNGRFIFVGALSRESVAPLSQPRHQYVSFNRARDRFADALDGQAGYRRAGFVNLGNVLLDDPAVSTGDHDGMAAVMEVRDR
jgi:hypothetical protein